MKVLVTGANGYIGQGVVNELLDMGVCVIASDISTENINKKANVISGDIFSMDNPYEELGKPNMLIHLAWRDGFKHYSDTHLNDLPKHYKFIQNMIDSGVSKVCVMGSMHEVGFFEGSIDENTPCRPLSLYGIAKNALRQAVEQLTKEKNVGFIWLRGYYIVGNTEHGCSIFSKITQAEHLGQKEFPFTSGENQFDFIEYNLFCKQIACASLQENIFGVIECCIGKPEKLSDRVERFIQDNEYKIKLAYGKFPDRPYDSKAVWGNNRKINDVMNAYKDN